MSDVRLLREVPVPLRDGTVTRAEAWLPDGPPGPAILVRTPYLKEKAAPSPVVDVRLATERRYRVVVQDVRGRGSSEGEFEPFVNEEADGADSVAWVAEQSWCDGRVVMAGMSYVGATQWLAAAAAPPALRGIAPTMSSDDYAECWSYTGGVPELGLLATWNAIDLAPFEKRWHDDPLSAFDDLEELAAIAPWSAEWLRGEAEPDYWSSRSVAHRRDDVTVPVLVIGGWYDTFCDASLRSFARSRHQHDRLVVGPWGHDAQLSHLVGDANVGIEGSGVFAELFRTILDFYDAVLAGEAPELPRVSVYVLGARRWVGLDAWPPPGAERAELPIQPAVVSADPADPVPSLGGRGLLVEVPGSGFGIRDQRAVAARDDVAVALHHAVAERRWLAGPACALLRTEAEPGSMWAVTLCVQQPDGALHNLTEGVGTDEGDGGATVSLGDVCATVEPGQPLVALVAGSSFPRWPRPKRLGTQRVLEGSRLELTTGTARL
ncbi:MAG TPA: CocE/NonD family hydrolase [Thermoleophilaceae bacterium]